MSMDAAQLQAEIDALRAENEALRATSGGSAPVDETAPPRTGRSNWWRGLLSAVCIIVAGILVPVSIVAAWARTELVSEQAFVQTFAPLVDDPGVQQLIITQATAAVDEAIDVQSFTNDLFNGLSTLDLPPAAKTALGMLRAPAASGLQSLIESSISRVVESDAFAAIWQRSLLASHRALVAVATNDSSNAVSVDSSGSLGIQLGPIIDELKSSLVEQGFGFASAIPSIDRTIVIVQSDALRLVGTVYTLAVTLGWWLPVIAFVLFLLGILIARRRSTAVLGTGVAIALGSGALAAALAGAGLVIGMNAGNLDIPAATLDTIFSAVVGAMRDTALVLMFLGIVIAVTAWLSGRWAPAVRVRTVAGSLTAGARTALQRRGVNTGRFGNWLYVQRTLVRIVILVLALILLFIMRPLSIGDILLTVALGLAVWFVVELLQRDPALAVAPDGAAGSSHEDPVERGAEEGAPSQDELVSVGADAASTDDASAAEAPPETSATPPLR